MASGDKKSKLDELLSQEVYQGPIRRGGGMHLSTEQSTSTPTEEYQNTAETPQAGAGRQDQALPPQGGRERQDIPFHQRHKTENIQLDKRLMPAYQQLLRRKGRNKTDALNRIILEACLHEGIEVDPSLLDKPFSFEDVAPDYR